MSDDGKNGKRARLSIADKRRIVMESEEAGVSVADVARRNGVSDSRLWEWRRQKRLGQLEEDAGSVFIPVRMTEDPVSAPLDFCPAEAHEAHEAQSVRGLGLMEIDLGGHRLVRVDREVDTDALRRVLDALSAR